MSGRIPIGLLKAHNRIGAILSEMTAEDAATVVIDHIELMGLRGTAMWAKSLDRERKRTGKRPELDRRFSGLNPVRFRWGVGGDL
jgi:hypothetical protein